MAEMIRRVWLVKEVPDKTGELAQRQSMLTIAVDDQTDKWYWIRPDERLGAAGIAEWNRIMKLLENVHGEDLRHVVCGVGLMDHCLDPTSINCYCDNDDPPKAKNDDPPKAK